MNPLCGTTKTMYYWPWYDVFNKNEAFYFVDDNKMVALPFMSTTKDDI